MVSLLSCVRSIVFIDILEQRIDPNLRAWVDGFCLIPIEQRELEALEHINANSRPAIIGPDSRPLEFPRFHDELFSRLAQIPVEPSNSTSE